MSSLHIRPSTRPYFTYLAAVGHSSEEIIFSLLFGVLEERALLLQRTPLCCPLRRYTASGRDPTHFTAQHSTCALLCSLRVSEAYVSASFGGITRLTKRN